MSMSTETTVLDIEDLMMRLEDSGLLKKHSIYKIPSHMKDENPRAYTPQMVSIGPYHFGDPRLAAMQAHKARSLQQFLARTNKSLEYYIDALRPLTQELLDSYEMLDEHWWSHPTKFLELMVLDGVFLNELMRRIGNQSNDLVSNLDFIRNFSHDIAADILMMENQLPVNVLKNLVNLLNVQTSQLEYLLNGQTDNVKQDKAMRLIKILDKLHHLDSFRTSVIEKWDLKSTDKYLDPLTAVKSASELLDAGVQFQAIDRGRIWFKGGTLSLSVFVFNDTWTEPVFLNFIAFEKLHPTGGTEVSSFVAFMQGLISSARDVSILKSRGVIKFNSRWGNEDILNMMNKISKHVLIDPSSELCEVRDSLNKYYDNKMKSRIHRMKLLLPQWWQNLLQTHFKSPWTMLSLFAGTVLLVLTLLQTIYTMKTYYDGTTPSS